MKSQRMVSKELAKEGFIKDENDLKEVASFFFQNLVD